MHIRQGRGARGAREGIDDAADVIAINRAPDIHRIFASNHRDVI